MTQDYETFMEENVFPIIALAGESKSLAYEALRLAKENKFEESDKKMQEADKLLLESHQYQTDLISKEANGESFVINLLFIHAQDHLMTSMLARELAEEIIHLYQR